MKSNKNSAWKAFALTVTMNVLWVGTCFSLPDEGPKKNGFGKKFKTIFLNKQESRPDSATGEPFEGWDISTCLQYMPNDFITFGLEFVSRHTNVPYFSGRGGVTSPNGWNPPIGDPAHSTADLVKDESRIILSTIVRF